MRAFLSILGLWNHDETVFKYFKVPSGLDKETAINKILFDCAELGLVYTEPSIFKTMVKTWVDSNLDNWNRMYTALTSEYDPIHNYNKYEEWTDDRDITNDSKTSDNGTNEHDVAGFNENATLVKDYKDTAQNTSVLKHDGTDNLDHKGHIYGNIGVTTNQQMITAEMEMRVAYNMYTIICQSFKNNFCIQVY